MIAEIHRSAQGADPSKVASMRPRSDDRGNKETRDRRENLKDYGFNEAAIR